MFLWHEHAQAKVRYISTSLVLVFCIIWYICIIAGTEPQDSHACLSDTQMFVASICNVLACKSAAPKVLWCYSNYCSQACSVAAKATAFCICIFILKFWLDCPYFSSDFGGVSALPLGFTCEVLVASSSMPSANREWYLLGPYNVQSLVSFYPDLPHWHPSPVTEKNQMCECHVMCKVGPVSILTCHIGDKTRKTIAQV